MSVGIISVERVGGVPIERRRDLCSVKVTLDGKPAVIGGVKNRFAGVTVLPDGPTYEWTWLAVERIVTEKGGRFQS